MRGRPNLYTSYESESQLMPTLTKKVALGLFLLVLVLMPFDLPVIDQIPFIRFLGDNVWLGLINRTLCFAIAAGGVIGGQHCSRLYIAQRLVVTSRQCCRG